MDLDGQVARLRAEGKLHEASTLAIEALTPGVLGYLRPMLGVEDDVADALSQWAERVWLGLPSFQGRSSLKTWSIRIACNVALNMRNEAHRRRERRFETGEASALAASVRTSSGTMLERRREALAEIRRELSAEEQTIIHLRTELELPWDEISDILAESSPRVSADTLSKRYERLKARLAKLAREKGLID